MGNLLTGLKQFVRFWWKIISGQWISHIFHIWCVALSLTVLSQNLQFMSKNVLFPLYFSELVIFLWRQNEMINLISDEICGQELNYLQILNFKFFSFLFLLSQNRCQLQIQVRDHNFLLFSSQLNLINLGYFCYSW